MALFRRLFYRKPPDRLLEISERIYVFDCCFSSETLKEDEFKTYSHGVLAQLQDHFPDASFMVFNFREGGHRSKVSDILSQYDMTVMDYPQQYEGCPLLPLEMVHHFLRSSESWLSPQGQQNVLLLHCERGGWPVLAFMLASLLLYRKHYSGEQKTLEMVYKQAPKELLHLFSPLDPQPSHLRYLEYISRRGGGPESALPDAPLMLEYLVLRALPNFNGEGRHRPMFRVRGQDPLTPASRSSRILFSTQKASRRIRTYRKAEREQEKVHIHCRVQGDVVLECFHLEDSRDGEHMVFHVMFNTAFIQSNMLVLSREEIDVEWNAKDRFPKDFKAELSFSDSDAGDSGFATEDTGDEWHDLEVASSDEFFEAEDIFNSVDSHEGKGTPPDSVIPQSTSTGDDISGSESETKIPPNEIISIHQESLGSHVETAKRKTVSRWITPKKHSDVTSVNLPSHPPSRYNSSPAALVIISESSENDAVEHQDTRLRNKMPDSMPPVHPQLPSCPPPPPPPPPSTYHSRLLPPPPPICSTPCRPPPPPPRPPPTLRPRQALVKEALVPPRPPLPPPLRNGAPPTTQPTIPSGSHGRPPVHAPVPPGSCGVPPPSPPKARGGAPPPRMQSPTLPISLRASGPPPPPSSAGGALQSSSNSLTDGRGRSSTRSSSPGPSSLAPRRSSLKPLHWIKVSRVAQGTLWAELQKFDDAPSASEFDVADLERLFSTTVTKSSDAIGSKSGGHRRPLGSKLNKVHLIDLRRANNCEIMLTKVKMPLPDMMGAVLSLDGSILDADQVENLIRFCPTKEEMELLKGYTADKEHLGKCEQFFLELMKVPRVEAKLRVFLFKIQFDSQISDLRKSLKIVNSACNEIRNSIKLKDVMKKILFLGNTLNQGTVRGSAIGFRLDSLLKLTDTRASNSKMTLMHYLCKVLARNSLDLLGFHEDLVSLDLASKIQLKSLAEEMQAIVKGLDKVLLELTASENDGLISDVFYKTLKEFTSTAEAEVRSLVSFYAEVGRNIDALAVYFGEDPSRCPFEQVTTTLLSFIRMFRGAHEENLKMAELERKKSKKEVEVAESKPAVPRRKNARNDFGCWNKHQDGMELMH